MPAVGSINAIPGVNINEVPGLCAPNFWGGGSPEIKGLVKDVAGMTDFYATTTGLGKNDLLYFKGGAQGVAVSESGKIYTSALTIPPADRSDKSAKTPYGFFSFKSTPERLPLFNSTSDQTFEKSPDTVLAGGQELPTFNTEIVYFAIDPENESIIYASFRDPEFPDNKNLARKNPDNGKWEFIASDGPGGFGKAVWGALAVDHDGNLYIADAAHHVIVKARFDGEGKAESWQIIAGKFDEPGFENEDGEDARFNKPSGICLDDDDNVYVGDAGNNVIRKIDEDGEVTTYAGKGTAGFKDDSWSKATFDGPTALAYNEVNKKLYVVDFNNKLIREINEDRDVSTLAGNAGVLMTVYYALARLNTLSEAKFVNPTGIAVDPSGLGLYVSDGKYVKYVNIYDALFVVTSAIGDPRANLVVTPGLPAIPILPYGIVMNHDNGAFLGIPSHVWQPTVYTISVRNHQGFSLVNGVIFFEVIDCGPTVDTVTENKTILPTQLPYTWNGIIFNGAGEAYARLKTSLGCDSVVLMKLLLKPVLRYNCEPYIFSLGVQINTVLPTTAGSKIDAFSISPALPNGLTLNAQTGEITGTPLESVTTQPYPAIGPKTPNVYAAPWALTADKGADISQVKIFDCDLNPIFENNSGFRSLVGSAGTGTGTHGAYTDFSGIGAIRMSTNTPYSVQLSNTLSGGYVQSLNSSFDFLKFMNSFAVYIDYNRDGDFADAGERVYISLAPQRDAHSEFFNLNIPASVSAGVTKMRIYCVEAETVPNYYYFRDGTGVRTVRRTTEQALSFYPFWNNFQDLSPKEAFPSPWLSYGEFEDYNIEIVNPVAKAYVISGTNSVGTAQSTIKIAINNPNASITNLTICSTELPYNWNGLVFSEAGTLTAHLINRFGADSAATLNLLVKQATSSVIAVANCGPYTYKGVVYTNSGDYSVHLINAAGCDSAVIFRFRQKATSSLTNLDIIPSQLPYVWNGLTFTTAGTKSATMVNAEGCDSTATLHLRVLYSIYYPAISLLPVNKPITPLSPVIEGNYPLGAYNASEGYNISPSLPNGLVLDPITGVISGTPTVLSPLKTYTVTLLQDGAKTSSFKLSVGIPTASATIIDNCGPYTWNEVVYKEATTITASFVNQYGFDSTAKLVLAIRNPSASLTNLFVSQAELPLTWNGINISQEGSKTIYLVNAVGCDSAATVNVVVGPKIVYTSPHILQQNQTIVPISPENFGGNIPSVIGNVSTLFKNNHLTPITIALDRQGNSYVSDELDKKIYKITRGGVISVVGGFGTIQALLAIDQAGNIYAADRFSNRILKKDTTGIITVLANASSPNGIAVDTAGNVYFSEGNYHRIRKISTGGLVSTLAGGPTPGFANGNGGAAKFNNPSGLCVDSFGNVYVADHLNNRIRKVTGAGEVTTFAGTGIPNSIDDINSNAGFNAPIDIAADNWGNKYVADNGSSKIRKIDASGMVSTLAGTTAGYQDGAGAQSKFDLPVALTADQHGNVYVADKANAAIRQINAINYTIRPSLVEGLQFDEATGIISGSPVDTLPSPVTYSVYAFNKAGADSVKIVIGVCNPAATSFTVDTCDQYRWNDSTYSSSTTHTRYLKNRGGCDSVVTMHLIIRKGSTGLTTTATACGSYDWKGTTYNQSGLYAKHYTNAVGCDSVIYLNLTIKPLSFTNLFVDLNPLQFPYTWRDKIFTVPDTQSIVYVNSVGCDSIVSMTVRISTLLPNISYATRDTILYWEKKIDVPIAMTNTGTPIPQMKLVERDTLVNFSNDGPGDLLRNTVKGLDGDYYTTVANSNQIFKLNKSGVWTVFATPSSSAVKAMAVDKSGNMYVAVNEVPTQVRKITPNGVVSILDGSPLFYGIDAMSVDADNNLILATQKIDNQLQITKFNLSTNQYVQTQMDYSPYFDLGELGMKTDSKGSIYLYTISRTSIMKIKSNGQVSGIGQKGSSYSVFKPGNGTDALIPAITSMAIDSTNDNVYLMADGYLLRMDTSGNVSALTGSRWFDQFKDQVFRLDSGKISILNNSTRILYTANVYGIGSLPFMDNYGGNALTFNGPKTDFKNFDKRIRLDSTGAIVGTPRGNYTSQGNFFATNTSTAYSIIAANRYGIGNFPMVITTKAITYISETFVTTSFPYIWRGRSFDAPTDTATYFATSKTLDNDVLYTLRLIYEAPEPGITTTGNCVGGQITLTASAAKNAIGFDGTNVANIKHLQNGSGLGYYNGNFYTKPDNSFGSNFSSAYEVWIKPASVSGTQYILTRDTVQSHGAFIGLSIQNGKLVYEFTKGNPTIVPYKLTSNSNILPNVWTHVAASYYDSALHVFINGQEEGIFHTPNSFSIVYQDPVTNANVFPDFFVGGLGRQFGFKGEMDELRVWSTVRDKTAIQATRLSRVAPLSTGLALYYRFDGDVSDGAFDISISNRWAKLIKPATSVSPSMAPIDFVSYNWMPGGATTKSIAAVPMIGTALPILHLPLRPSGKGRINLDVILL